MSRQRRAQYKPEREPSKIKELSELRQENRQLRKQVAKLRKQVEQALATGIAIDEVTIEESPEPTKCSRCNSLNLIEFQLPDSTSFIICKSCRLRTRGSHELSSL